MDVDWLVGRRDEVALLEGLVGAVAAGIGGVVLVEGEQGIGKTALLREGLAGAAAAGCRVVWGAADELGQRFPLELMMECLGSEGRLAGLGSVGGVEGGPLMLAGDPVLAGVERLLVLVDRWCSVSPVVVVAEDLQWADEASVLVWNRLSRAVGQMPLLLAGSLRPAPGRDDLAGVRQGLVARGGDVVSLGPLLPADVADLVGRLAGGPPGSGLAGLVARAGGNPLYTRELVDALVRGGRVRVAGGVAELVGEVAGVGVPVSLAGMIEGRLGSLGEGAVGALRWAAVLGQEFSVTDLEVVTGRDAYELTGVVVEAVAAGVVTEAGPRLAFRHAMIRQVLYEGMPGSLRAALHVQAARALAGAGAAPEQVAAQLVAGPEHADGWVRGWLAGAAPTLVYRAPRVAAELLRGVLALMAEDDPGREVLEVALVQVAFLLLLSEEVERVGTRMLARALDPDRAAEIGWLVAYSLLRTVRAEQAAELMERMLARPGVGPAQTARLRALHGLILTALGQAEEAARVADEALAGAEAARDRFAAGYALHSLACVSVLRHDWAETVARTDRALAVIGDDLQTTDLRLMLLINRSTVLDEMDRRAEASATAQQALTLAERAGTHRVAEIRASLAAMDFAAGRWDDALAQLEMAITAPVSTSHPALVYGLAARIAVHRDDPQTAGECLAAVADISVRDAAWVSTAGHLLMARAMVAERAGRAGEAEEVLAQCLDPGLAEMMSDRDELLPMLTRLALAAGHATVAAAAQAAASEAEDEPLPLSARIAAACHCRGLVAADPEQVLAAADGFQAAGRPLGRGQALEDAAVLLAARGQTKAARAAFAEALGLYEALGAAWDIRRACTRLRPHGIRRGRRDRAARPDAGWAALTPTEAKVARLVAGGQSNPDIAAELFLSRNTVQTHVSHILAKLAARSRAEIVREAQHHLEASQDAAAR